MQIRLSMPRSKMYRLKIRDSSIESKQDLIIKNLLHEVWGFEGLNCSTEWELGSFREHYEDVARSTRPRTPGGPLLLNPKSQSADLIKYVNFVQRYTSTSFKNIRRELLGSQIARPEWHGLDAAADAIIAASIRLWLFVDIAMRDDNMDCKETIQESLLGLHKPIIPAPFSFSAKDLTRKAGFTFAWTSDLSKHLLFVSDIEINFFRHGRMLEYLSRSKEADFYPTGFLQEVQKTLRLFFPNVSKKEAHRKSKVQQRYDVDLEAQIELQDLEQPQAYYYFGARLAEIQRRYEAARPRTVSQWYYDRRSRMEWAALMIAVIVFILTVIFGLIQSVTGILQACATFRWR